MKITAQILTKNSEKSVAKAIESILSLNCDILVGDLGSTDNTVSICKKYNAKIIKLKFKNYSQSRNELLKKSETKWQFYIEPWEIFAYGTEKIQEALTETPKAFNFQIFREDIITKEIRLWNNNIQFSNPVYECLIDENAESLDAIIYSGVPDRDNKSFLEEWKKSSPLASEPFYYEACNFLLERKYDEFLTSAKRYLFREKEKRMPVIMTKYYMALIYHAKQNAAEAIRQILPCIAEKPLNAEFWCLLGDIYFSIHKYEKALVLYDNAIILGNKRLKTDTWPMEIKKYQEYPMKMKRYCEQMIEKSFSFGSAASKSNPTH
jgi:glycosyltransferase involved in cell wall biosynthesis